MMTDGFILIAAKAMLAMTTVSLVLMLGRRHLRRLLGARFAYGFWLAVPVAGLAALLPSEIVTLAPSAAEIAAFPNTAEASLAEGTALATSGLTSRPDQTASFDFPFWIASIWTLGFIVSLVLPFYFQKKIMRTVGIRKISRTHLEATTDHIGPAVIGLFSPRIILPNGFRSRYSRLERRLILAHEKAHIRAGDLHANAFAVLLRSCNWFNPIAYLAYNSFREDQELACDERVMQRHGTHRKTYAAALLKTQLASQALPASCGWLPQSQHPLKARISQLALSPGTHRKFISGGLALALTLVASGAGTWTTLSSHAFELPAQEKNRPTSRKGRLGASLVASLLDGRTREALLLINAGADVNHIAPGDGTALIVATRQGDEDMVRQLIDAGADVNMAVKYEGSPLIMAARQGRIGIVKMLVDAGANVNGFVLHDETPLIGAAAENRLEAAQYLIAQGADVNLKVPSGHKPPRPQHRSPLGQAEYYGNSEMIDLLRGHGANPPSEAED